MSGSSDVNVLVTRQLSTDQLKLGKESGLSIDIEPAIHISYRQDWLSVQTTFDKTDPAILVFTSQNAVKAIDQYKKAGLDLPGNFTVYTVGDKTKDALVRAGFRGIKTPEKQNGTALAHLVIDDILKTPELKNVSVLHLCGDKRRDELRHFLSESNIRVQDIVVYQTELNQLDLGNLGSYEGILFYSPSAVQAFRNSGGFRSDSLPELFAIGPTTGEELSIESGQHVHISPKPDTEIFLPFVARVLGLPAIKSGL